MSEQGLYLDPEDFLKSKVSQNPKLSATCEVSLGQLVIAENWISNFSLMATSLYVLFNNNNSDLIVWEERHSTAFRGLKQSLMNSSAFGLPMIRLFFFFSFLYMKGREYPWVTHPKIPLTHSILQTSSWTLCHRDIPLVLESLQPLPLWLRPTRKLLWGPL